MMKQLKIGNVTLPNRYILGPMAGVTDLPFRVLCKEQGAGLLCMEMVSAKAILYNNKNTESLLEIHPDEQPVSLQFFGSDPKIMSEMAKRVEERGRDEAERAFGRKAAAAGVRGLKRDLRVQRGGAERGHEFFQPGIPGIADEKAQAAGAADAADERSIPFERNAAVLRHGAGVHAGRRQGDRGAGERADRRPEGAGGHGHTGADLAGQDEL